MNRAPPMDSSSTTTHHSSLGPASHNSTTHSDASPTTIPNARAIFHRLFSDIEIAEWLLSKEPLPPSRVTERDMKNLISGELFKSIDRKEISKFFMKTSFNEANRTTNHAAWGNVDAFQAQRARKERKDKDRLEREQIEREEHERTSHGLIPLGNTEQQHQYQLPPISSSSGYHNHHHRHRQQQQQQQQSARASGSHGNNQNQASPTESTPISASPSPSQNAASSRNVSTQLPNLFTDNDMSEPPNFVPQRLTYICHRRTPTKCFLTLCDSQAPFTFLEEQSPAVPGVRRAVVTCDEHDALFAGYYWLENERSVLMIVNYGLYTNFSVLSGFVLLNTYPMSRYPNESDIIESALGLERRDCMFCILRGSDCVCPQRARNMLCPAIPAADQRDAWESWRWYFTLYLQQLRTHSFQMINSVKQVSVSNTVYCHLQAMRGMGECQMGADQYMSALTPLQMHPDIDMKIEMRLFGSMMGNLGNLNNLSNFGNIGHLNAETKGMFGALGGPSVKRRRVERLGWQDHSYGPGHGVHADGNGDLGNNGNEYVYGYYNEDGEQRGEQHGHGQPTSACVVEEIVEGKSDAPDQQQELQQELQQEQEQEQEHQQQRQQQDEAGGQDAIRTCAHCGAYFKRPFDLRRHIQTKHEKQRNYECDVCNKRFLLQQHLNAHKLQVHNEQNMKFECLVCHAALVSKSNWRRHMKSIHNIAGDLDYQPNRPHKG